MIDCDPKILNGRGLELHAGGNTVSVMNTPQTRQVSCPLCTGVVCTVLTVRRGEGDRERKRERERERERESERERERALESARESERARERERKRERKRELERARERDRES